jgi:periplasmic protein TonB
MQVNIPADLDEMVFEGRNKEYGSYVLRKQLARSTYRGFFIGAAILTVGFLFPQILALIEGVLPKANKLDNIEATLGEPPPISKDEPPPPPPVTPPPPPQRAQVRYIPPKVVKDEEAPEEAPPIDIDSLKNKDISTQNVEGNTDEEIPPTFEQAPVEVREEAPEPQPFEVFTGEEPKPVNMDEIRQLIGYPEVAREAGIQGQVVVRILVDKRGKYSKHLILNAAKAHPVLVKAVEERLNLLSFTPGIQAGKPVPVWVNIPFKFTLKN